MVEQSNPIRKYNYKSDNLLNLNRIIKLLMHYWVLFAISIPLFLISTYIYHRYTVTVYQASASLLFKSSEERTISSTDLIEGFGLSPEVRNIENQTFILRSFRIIRKVVEGIDFGIEYYIGGRFKDAELYHTSPFRIELDSTVNQILNVPISLTFNENGKILLNIKAESVNLFNVKDYSYTGSVGEINLTREVTWNDVVKLPYGSFKIIKTSGTPEYGKNYYFKIRSLDDVANEYRSRLGISTYNEGSSIVFLKVTGTSTLKIKRFLDKLCEVVIEHNLEQKNEIASRSIQFIQNQLDMISDTLNRTQNKLLNFRKENRFMNPSASSEQLANRYFEAEKQRKMLELKRDYYVFLRQSLHDDPYDTDFMLPAFSDNNYQLVSQLVLELLELNNDYQIYNNEANKVNPYMTTLRQKIEVTRNNLLMAINKVLENIALEENVLDREMKQIEDDMSGLPALEKKYLEIDRSYKLNDAIYTFLLQKNSETQITKASNTPDNEIIDQSYISAVVSPNIRSNYTKAVLFAILIPVIIIALIEFMNVKIRSKEDLDNLVPNIPLIGIIPHSKIESDNIMLSNPHSIISESFRSIRTRLNFMAVGDGAKVISITSTNKGDGKTFVSINLASAFAISGKKTILLGFDLRKPKLSEYFKMAYSKGISNVLIGEIQASETCYQTSQDNLCVMPSGEIPPNPSELIESDSTDKLFKWLRKNFDIIVVDSPPVGVVADARLLMSYTNIRLYITRFNHTRKDHLQHTIQNLQDENITSMGLIFNDVQNNVTGYGHYYTEYYGKEKS